ncbi:MAG: NAD(+)/NADH kinase [Oscillospiraceae bacterium]|nr:NAD(+)/NADH kinase [Oscillospiraceae bacterium]
MEKAILLCPNAHRDLGLTATRCAMELLRSRGHQVLISPFLSDGLEDTWPADLPTVSLEEGIARSRLAVTLGGDGTILQISRYLAGTGVPVLGVNMGHMGFLAELERMEIERLAEVADGDFTVLPRMMLDVELWRDGKVVYSARPLNEAVVRSLVSVVRFCAFGDGREITAFSGDGIIISTPTGSTAYSMAAGGPIVEPEAECIILTPICAFRLAARSFVLTADRHVSIRSVDQGSKEVMLSIDGEPVPFLEGDELRVRRSKETLLMARVSDSSFYDIVYDKLNDKMYTGGTTAP